MSHKIQIDENSALEFIPDSKGYMGVNYTTRTENGDKQQVSLFVRLDRYQVEDLVHYLDKWTEIVYPPYEEEEEK